MKRLAQLTSLVVTLGALSAACSGSIVTDGDDDGEGGSGGDGNGGAPGVTTTAITTGNTPPPPSPAISMLRWELDNPPGTSSSISVSTVTTGSSMNTTSSGPGSVVATTGVTTTGVTTGGNMTSSVSSGNPLDPNDLVIVLGSELQQCEDPFATNCATQNWRVTISLPTSMQQIGTYDLEGLANWFESDQCNGGGGGTFWEGTITITSIDPGQVDFVLAGTNDFFLLPGNADGAYSAPRCF
jgi:hypothetical protein